jgi:hypothetical protein
MRQCHQFANAANSPMPPIRQCRQFANAANSPMPPIRQCRLVIHQIECRQFNNATNLPMPPIQQSLPPSQQCHHFANTTISTHCQARSQTKARVAKQQSAAIMATAPLLQLYKKLGRAMGHRTMAHLYLGASPTCTLPGSCLQHYDHGDVLVIHLNGTTVWEVCSTNQFPRVLGPDTTASSRVNIEGDEAAVNMSNGWSVFKCFAFRPRLCCKL